MFTKVNENDILFYFVGAAKHALLFAVFGLYLLIIYQLAERGENNFRCVCVFHVFLTIYEDLDMKQTPQCLSLIRES